MTYTAPGVSVLLLALSKEVVPRRTDDNIGLFLPVTFGVGFLLYFSTSPSVTALLRNGYSVESRRKSQVQTVRT